MPRETLPIQEQIKIAFENKRQIEAVESARDPKAFAQRQFEKACSKNQFFPGSKTTDEQKISDILEVLQNHGFQSTTREAVTAYYTATHTPAQALAVPQPGAQENCFK